ncbi:hypothetical protein ACYO9G_00110 [Staphylococcus aureus]
MYLKTRYISIEELRQLGIADEYRLINYQAFNKMKEENKRKGVNLKMATNDTLEKSINIIDNSPIYYNGKQYKSNLDIFEEK